METMFAQHYVIVILCAVVTFSVRTSCDDACGGLLSARRTQCPVFVLTIPSDRSGIYNLKLNTSMPIYSNENLSVELENKKEVQQGTASDLIYRISHPSCEDRMRIVKLVFNGLTLCQNNAYEVTANQAATKFSYESTHFGEKNTQLTKPSALNPNDFTATLQKVLENNHLLIGGGTVGSQAFPNNPFLTSLTAPTSAPNWQIPSQGSNNQNPFSLDTRGGTFNNNPFLNGQSFTLPTIPPVYTRFFSPLPSPTPTPPTVPVDINSICGYSTYALIQGGTEVQPGEYPWLGGLFLQENQRYLCTVNLVSQKHAITAAHCFIQSDEANRYGMLWGHPKSRRDNKPYSHLSNILMHPRFNKSSDHDVAIAILANAVTFTLTLKPICLWKSEQSGPGTYGTPGIVAGFGPDYTDLKQIKFPIVSQETCLASNKFFHHATSEFTFCAGTRKDKEGPCKGDSGAGYMQWVRDRFYLRGLVSHSLNANGNCNLEEYIIFSDLSKEMNWIRETIT